MSRSPRPRVALVLGAGGVVGHAFSVGVLSALADELGWDARTADLIVGTSAGSVVGAGLRAGLHPEDLCRRARSEPLSPAGAVVVRRADEALAAAALTADGGSVDDEASEATEASDAGVPGAAWRLRIASPERLRRAVRQPWNARPGSLLSAVLPPGTRSTDHLQLPHDALHGDGWPSEQLWIVAVDLDVGPRVVFGRSGAPAASVGQAVAASCAIPGYFSPVTIEDSRYVDGGVHSTTNADLVAELEPLPDIAVICAPMAAASSAMSRSQPFSVRQLARRQVGAEVAELRRRGVATVTFQPTVEDLAVMSGDSMDPDKRGDVCNQAVLSTAEHLREPEIAARLAPLGR